MRPIDADALEYKHQALYKKGDSDEIFSEKFITATEINSAPTIDVVQHWIPCKEKLPKYLDYVLLSSPKHGLKIGARTKKSHFNSWYLNEPLDCDVWHVILCDTWYNFEDFTAWMPLPEPYVEERKNNESRT